MSILSAFDLIRVADSRTKWFREIIVQIAVGIFLVHTSFRAILGSIIVPKEIFEYHGLQSTALPP